MSVALLAIGAATFAILLVLLAGLIRNVRALAATLRRFEQEVRPLLEEIRAGSARAEERSDALASRVEAVKGREGTGTPGARLRG
jgi:hypothetical protein